MTSEQQVQNFIKELIIKLAVEKDIDQAAAGFDPDIAWVGMGEKGYYCGVSEVREMLLLNKITYDSDELLKSDYQVTALSDCVYMVTGKMLFSRSVMGRPRDMAVAITATCKKEQDSIRLCQMHCSAPGELYRRSEEQKVQDRDFKVVIDTIPGGVLKCREDEDYTILQTNEGFTKIVGYSSEEFDSVFQNRFIEVVYPPDREILRRMIRAQMSDHRKFSLEYRLVCKDGSLLWILDQSQLVKSPEGDYFYTILLDNTANKQALESLKMSLERHDIIMNQTNDIIFEWNITTDNLTVSANWEKRFGYSPTVGRIQQKLPLDDHVYPGDRKAIEELKKLLLGGASYVERELRIEKRDGIYIWCRVRITALYDQAGNPIRVIGAIIDIDREKRISAELTSRAERDLLTGLYNKETTRMLISKELKKHPDLLSAFMIIDLDDFKQINDVLGHFTGDKVLSKAAAVLSAQFRSSDIVGRIGGDEFVVFVTNVPSSEFVVKKANRIIQAFGQIAINARDDLVVSCSVGISMAPMYGTNFDELYQKADEALYTAKNHGKSRSHLY